MSQEFRRLINIVEAPISTWDVQPDLEDREKTMIGMFRGNDRDQKHWPDTDKKAMRHPTVLNKMKDAFLKTPYDFKLYFWQSEDPNYDKFLQVGRVDENFIREHLGGETMDRIIHNGINNSITVIMTNNLSDEGWKPVSSPWIMAHRIAHTILSGNSAAPSAYGAIVTIHALIERITKIGYGVQWPVHSKVYYEDVYTKIIGQIIGTMKSAREKTLVNGYEFIHELFAQHLLTGRITFNTDLPKSIHKDHKNLVDPKKIEELQKTIRFNEKKISRMFNEVLQDSVGEIYVM